MFYLTSYREKNFQSVCIQMVHFSHKTLCRHTYTQSFSNTHTQLILSEVNYMRLSCQLHSVRANLPSDWCLLIMKGVCFQILKKFICFYFFWTIFFGAVYLLLQGREPHKYICRPLCLRCVIRGTWPCFQEELGGSQISSQTAGNSWPNSSRHSDSGRRLRNICSRMFYFSVMWKIHAWKMRNESHSRRMSEGLWVKGFVENAFGSPREEVFII